MGRMKDNIRPDEMSFWEHVEVLRASLIKMAIVIMLCSVMAFLFKEEMFSVLLAPKNDAFITYSLFRHIAEWTTGKADAAFSIQLINTGLTEQFVIHMKASVCIGFLISSPYLLYQFFHFISPALYENERKYSLRVAGSGYVMFILGVLLSYFLIFPLTFRFLGTYQVSSDVTNMITLQSYMGTLLMMCSLMGIVFELPVLCWLLAKLGLLSSRDMRRFRKHSIVVILIISAVITPTSDIFTLSLVALPVWLLYEVSILIVSKSVNRKSEFSVERESR